MWYGDNTPKIILADKNDDYLSFLVNEISFLQEMQEKYPRKAAHLDKIITRVETAIANMQNSVLSPKDPNPRITSVPRGFHDKLRRTTFDLMNQNPNMVQSLESYHEEVPLGRLSPLDRLYLSQTEKIRSHYDPIRQMLRDQHGDTMKLYRAEDINPIMSYKPISAYTNARGVAEQFVEPGRHVVERQVPIDSIWGASRFISDSGERPSEFWIENSKL